MKPHFDCLSVPERQIVHIDLDAFFVSVERLQNSALLGKPVIIGGTSDRGVVSSCSYEARRFGVASAMPIKMARRLCPEAVFIHGDMDLYSRYSEMVTEVIAEKVPLFEKASIDEHYLDMTGMDRFYGTLQWTRELRKTIADETGLPASFGLSVNKTVAKIATGESKPNGERMVSNTEVTPFLWPLSIRKIPMIGEKTYVKLRSMGISIIQTLAGIPPEMLESVMGQTGKILWLKANGIDQTPVEPYSERKSISTETTFDRDSTDVQAMRRMLIRMVEDLCFGLRKQGKLTSCITVKIRYSDFDTRTMQKKIPYTSLDNVIIETTLELFMRLYNRRMLIRLIGLKFSGLVNGMQQVSLFEDTAEQISLYHAIDRIKKKFGEQRIGRAC
jgi:DNA polymerase-4